MKSDTIKVLYYGQHEQPEWLEIDNTLEAKQKLVQGYIEFVDLKRYGGPNAEAVVNEEGRFLFSSNRVLGNTNDTLAGPFIVVGPCDKNGDSTSLDENTAEKVREFFKYVVLGSMTM